MMIILWNPWFDIWNLWSPNRQ